MSFVVTRKSQTKEVSIIPEYRGYERIGHILSSQHHRHRKHLPTGVFIHLLAYMITTENLISRLGFKN